MNAQMVENLRQIGAAAERENTGLVFMYRSGGAAAEAIARDVKQPTAPQQTQRGDWFFVAADTAHPERTCSSFRLDRIAGCIVRAYDTRNGDGVVL